MKILLEGFKLCLFIFTAVMVAVGLVIVALLILDVWYNGWAGLDSYIG